MRTFTVKNATTPGLRISPPTTGMPAWHLCVGGGDIDLLETLIPVSAEVSDYLDALDADLQSAVRGQTPKILTGYTREQLEAARAETFDGWMVDDLSYDGVDTLHHSKAHPKGGPCTVHLAVPSMDGKVHIEASSYDEVLEGGRIRRQYHAASRAAGIEVLHSGEGPGGVPEYLLQMERGASFRIRRAAGPWTEALVLWTGHELKLLPSRKGSKHHSSSREHQLRATA